MVVPQSIYWLNLQLFSGSNIALGLVVVALVVGHLVVVALLLRHSALRPVERMAIFVVASALLFDLTGTWNFSKAMSGTAWRSGSAFVTICHRRRRALPTGGRARARDPCCGGWDNRSCSVLR